MIKKITFILLLCITTKLKAQWEIKVYSTNVRNIVSNGHYVAAGSDDALVHYSSNSGKSWMDIALTLTDKNIYAVSVDGPKIFAGALGKGVYFSADSGDNWTSRFNGLTNQYIKVLHMKGPYLFAGTLGIGGMFRSSNEGKSWSSINNGLTNKVILSMVSNDTNIFAATDGGGIFQTSDYGDTWIPVNVGLTDTSIYSLAASGSTLYAGCLNGVFKSIDNGRNWVKLKINLKDVRAIAAKDNYVFAASWGGGFFTSSNGGNTWQLFNENLPSVYIQSLAINDDYVFVSVNGSGIWARQIVEMVSGIQEIKTEQLEIYSNPNSGKFQVKVNLFDKLCIYDLQGQLVYESNGLNAKDPLELNLTTITTGIYTLEITSMGNIIHKKIVIN